VSAAVLRSMSSSCSGSPELGLVPPVTTMRTAAGDQTSSSFRGLRRSDQREVTALRPMHAPVFGATAL
jgi:hypothetical protein